MVLLERAKERSKIGQLNSFWFKFVSSLYIPGIMVCCVKLKYLLHFAFCSNTKADSSYTFFKIEFYFLFIDGVYSFASHVNNVVNILPAIGFNPFIFREHSFPMILDQKI